MKVAEPTPWQRKESIKKHFLSNLAATKMSTHCRIVPLPGGDLEATVEILDENRDMVFYNRVICTPQTRQAVQEAAFDSLLNALDNDITLGKPVPNFPIRLGSAWRAVSEVQSPVPSIIQVISGAYTNTQAPKQRKDDPMSPMEEAVENTLNRHIAALNKKAWDIFEAKYPNASLTNSMDFTQEERYQGTFECIKSALQTTNKPITSLTAQTIVDALLVCEENEGTSVDTVLIQLLDPPPFDPFDL